MEDDDAPAAMDEAISGGGTALAEELAETTFEAVADAAHVGIEAAIAGGLANLGKGSVVGAVRAARRAVLPTGDESLEDAKTVEIDDAVFSRLPAVERKAEALAHLANDIHESILGHAQALARATTQAIADELAKHVRAGTLAPEAVEESEVLRDSVLRACRYGMDAVDPAVVPALARLAALHGARRFDRTAHRVCRMLIELESAELRDLVLVCLGVRVVLDRGPTPPSAISLHTSDGIVFASSERTGDGPLWPSAPLTLAPSSQILSVLDAARLANNSSSSVAVAGRIPGRVADMLHRAVLAPAEDHRPAR